MSPTPGHEARTTFSEPMPGSRKMRWQSLLGKFWSLSTYLYQRRIYWQDRFGWFRYQDWIKTVETTSVQTALAQGAGQSTGAPSVCFALVSGTDNRADVLRTLNALHQYAPDYPAVFFLPKTSLDLQANWLQELLKQNRQLSVIEIEESGLPGAWIQFADQIPADWAIPLRAGDCIAPFWSKLFSYFVTQAPQAQVIYWDEDCLDEKGRRLQPFFKPDWSPELLFSVNYLETAAFHKSLLLSYQKLNRCEQGSWIFEVAHAAECLLHIPFILQHRKARSAEEKQHAAAQHAENARLFLQGQGFKDVKVRLDHGHPRLAWKVEKPLVSIIIPTKNNLHYLRRCITSLLEKTAYPAYEILLMDDHSTDPEVLAYYQAIQAASPCLHVYENEGEFNYSRVNNQGARLAKGDLLLFLNNDVEILNADWLDELVQWTLMPGVGMAGAKLLYPDKTIQHAGIVLGMTGHANHLFAGQPPVDAGWFVSSEDYRNVSAVTGACMLVHRDLFTHLSGFDEDLGLVFNDVDLGVRVLHAGERVVYTPAAQLIHYEGRSRGRRIPPQDIRLGAERLFSEIARGDRYYNPNLSLAVNWPTFRRNDEPTPITRLNKIIRNKG